MLCADVRLLITGVGGFLGGAAARALAAEGHTMLGTSRSGAPSGTVFPVIACDLARSDEIAELFAQGPFDAVVHAAAVLPNRPDFETAALRDNVAATALLLAAARASGVRRFVYCSSVSVYEGQGPFRENACVRPTALYGSTKHIGEMALAACASVDMKGFSLRIAGLHGPGRATGVVAKLVQAALRGEPLQVGEPESRFRLCFLEDAIAAIRLCLNAAPVAPYTCLNIASAETFTLKALAERVAALTRSASPIRLQAGAAVRDATMDIAAAEAMGFHPLGLDHHLAVLIAEARN